MSFISIIAILIIIYWGYCQHKAGNMVLWRNIPEIIMTFCIYIIPVIIFAILAFCAYADFITWSFKTVCYISGLLFAIATTILGFNSYEINKDNASFFKSFFTRFFIAIIGTCIFVVALLPTISFENSHKENQNG